MSETHAPDWHRRRWYVAALLLGVYACHVLDRTLLNLVFEPVKHEFALSDSQLGLLAGLAYGLPFALTAFPMGMLADRVNRVRLLAAVIVAWSVLTVFSGRAWNYLSLLLARAGVGALEAGGPPNAVSLLADYFPPRQRATATAIYMAGSAVGMFIAFACGGLAVAAWGWRATFFAAGVPGIALALLLLFTVAEPARDGAAAAHPPPSLRATLMFMRRQRSLRHLVMVIVLTAASGTACNVWLTSYLVRFHGIPLREAGLVLAVALGICGAAGIALGGIVADRAAARQAHGRIRVPMRTLLIAALLWIAVLLATRHVVIIVLLCLWATFATVWGGPVYGTIVSLVRTRERGLVMSLSTVLGNLVGASLGPQLVGGISDACAPFAGAESLRYALLAPVAFNLLAAWHCRRATRTLQQDLAAAA